jgi:hypothetical protein
MSRKAGRFVLWTVFFEGSVALTHTLLGTNKPWLWDCASHGLVAGCTLYVAHWLDHQHGRCASLPAQKLGSSPRPFRKHPRRSMAGRAGIPWPVNNHVCRCKRRPASRPLVKKKHGDGKACRTASECSRGHGGDQSRARPASKGHVSAQRTCKATNRREPLTPNSQRDIANPD